MTDREIYLPYLDKIICMIPAFDMITPEAMEFIQEEYFDKISLKNNIDNDKLLEIYDEFCYHKHWHFAFPNGMINVKDNAFFYHRIKNNKIYGISIGVVEGGKLVSKASIFRDKKSIKTYEKTINRHFEYTGRYLNIPWVPMNGCYVGYWLELFPVFDIFTPLALSYFMSYDVSSTLQLDDENNKLFLNIFKTIDSGTYKRNGSFLILDKSIDKINYFVIGTLEPTTIIFGLHRLENKDIFGQGLSLS